MRYIATIGIPKRVMDQIDACFYRNAYGHTFEITFPNGAPFNIGSFSYSCGPTEYIIDEGSWDGYSLQGIGDYPDQLLGVHVFDSYDETDQYEFRISVIDGDEITTEFSEEESK